MTNESSTSRRDIVRSAFAVALQCAVTRHSPQIFGQPLLGASQANVEMKLRLAMAWQEHFAVALDPDDVKAVIRGGRRRATTASADGEDQVRRATYEALRRQGRPLSSASGMLLLLGAPLYGFRRADLAKARAVARGQAPGIQGFIYGLYPLFRGAHRIDATLLASWD